MVFDEAGTYQIEYTATDECGNTTNAERTVIVEEPPTYRTVLYTDGTFIINESSTDEAANVEEHGEATNVYAALGSGNNYIFNGYTNVLWYSERTLIRRVEVGSVIHPSMIQYWFYGMSNCTSMDLSNIVCDSLRSMRQTFNGCSSLTELDLSNFETSYNLFEDLYMTFYRCSNLSVLDISKLITSNVSEMGGMFRSCSKLKTIYASESFTTENVTSSGDMFDGMSTDLVGGAGTVWSSSNPTDKTYAHIDGGVSDPGYFTAKN